MRRFILFLFVAVIPYLSFAQNSIGKYELPGSAITQYYKQQLTDQVISQLNKIDWNNTSEKVSSGTTLFTIPVVVHVLHNYGAELLPDTAIYRFMEELNSYFLKTNPDTVDIINKFKPIAASTQIAFKLATIDPSGNQTKGIDHIYTYLTYNGSDPGKIGQWPQDKYLNIWLVNSLYSGGSGVVSGYAYRPYEAASMPYYDGIVFSYLFSPYGNVSAHLAAKYLSLPVPCITGSGCGDNDLIPDTPPCGTDNPTFYACSTLYDTTCDTPNSQNIMYDNGCQNMFTYGQGQYMQEVLGSDVGKRDSLVTVTAFISTGMDAPMPDMLPVPDFYVRPISSSTAKPNQFAYLGQHVTFVNESWNDTITAASWTFSNGPSIASSSSLINVVNSFTQPGWVSTTLSATGNNTGTASLTRDHSLYVADTTPVNGAGYYQEFNSPGDLDKWPIFNYYNNNFQWQLTNVGAYDNACMEYTGYDPRPFPENMAGTPKGDIDDFFSPVFDLTSLPDSSYLNFMSSGATIATSLHSMTDTLEISYATDFTSGSWHLLKYLTKDSLCNKGTISTPYIPESIADWIPHAIPLPAAARTAHTTFRFRYHPGADSTGVHSSGNNFYLDRINLNSVPESVSTYIPAEEGISLFPNPTHTSATVVIQDKAAIGVVNLIVTDISGRVVYEYNYFANGTNMQLAIPEDAITDKGVYLVHIIAGKQNRTEKLVVY